MIGFAGLIVVNIAGKGLDFDFSLLGEGFILIAALSGAMAQGYIKKFSKDANVVMLSGYQFFFGGVVMSVVGLVSGGHLSLSNGGSHIIVKAILLLLYMGFISAAAYTLWGILLKYNDVSKVATCKFMNPIFGAVISFIILNETGTLGPQTVIALVMVCAGIFIVNYEKH